MGSPEHGHESSSHGEKGGCAKLGLKVLAGVMALSVVPMETRGYFEKQSHLPLRQRDSSWVGKAEGILRYMGRDLKSILLGGIDETRDKVEKF